MFNKFEIKAERQFDKTSLSDHNIQDGILKSCKTILIKYMSTFANEGIWSANTTPTHNSTEDKEQHHEYCAKNKEAIKERRKKTHANTAIEQLNVKISCNVGDFGFKIENSLPFSIDNILSSVQTRNNTAASDKEIEYEPISSDEYIDSLASFKGNMQHSIKASYDIIPMKLTTRKDVIISDNKETCSANPIIDQHPEPHIYDVAGPSTTLYTSSAFRAVKCNKAI